MLASSSFFVTGDKFLFVRFPWEWRYLCVYHFSTSCEIYFLFVSEGFSGGGSLSPEISIS